VHAAATAGAAGFLSAADKATLDKLGVAGGQSSVPDSAAPQDQASTAGQAPSSLSGAGETQQPGAKQDGMTMGGPMMHGSTREPAQASKQGMMQMMQGQMQSGQMQPGSMRPGPGQRGMTMSGPMMHGSTQGPAQASMQGMMRMMQGMMQMIEGQMQPGRIQPGSMRPGPERGDMMMDCPMMQETTREPMQASMQGMMQMMQGMMQMMQEQMQPRQVQPGPMRPEAR
jgi:hypothetical protein